jgi:hypothetical protein
MTAPFHSTLTLPSVQRGLSIHLMVHTEASRGLSAVITHNKSGASIAFICASDRHDCRFHDAYDGTWELWMLGGHVCLTDTNAVKAAKFLGIPFSVSGEASC